MPRPLEDSDPLSYESDADHFRQRREFRTNLALTAFVHLLVLLGFFLVAHFQPQSKVEPILWLDGGLAGGGGAASPSTPPESEPEPDPIPEPPRPEPAPTPLPEPVISSEIPQPTATPKPATPKPLTPKPATPKATPKTTPKKAATPKPKASPSPTTPKPATNEAKASPAPARDKSDEAGTKPARVKTSGKGSNDMIGEGKGKGTAGSGAGAGKPSDFGWYFSLLRDKYYAVWSPPTLPDSGSLIVTLKIRVKRDGSVLGYDLIKSSGNSLMDGSVLEAARQVSQIDPLPDGLGKENIVEIPVNFKPE
jgi:TonB family protein